MRRVAVASGLAAVAIIAACADRSGLDAGVDGAPGDAATIDGSHSADAGLSDADYTSAEAGLVDVTVVDGSGCCDCDGDQYGGDGSCKVTPGDCDDTIATIRPGAGFALNPSWPSSHVPAFDWNCDGTVTKQLFHNLECAAAPGSCTGEGFAEDPPCGGSATYFTCVPSGVSCVRTASGQRTQSCR